MMKNLFRTSPLTVITAAALFLGACKETELPVPVTKPATRPSTPTPPASETGNPPAGQTPPVPGAPAVPGQLRKIKWAPQDFKEFAYNDQGGLVKYSRQYNSVQGTDIVRRDEFTYAYDSAGRVISVTTGDGFVTTYSYAGDVWSEALSLDKLGRPLRKYTFTFNDRKQLTAYADYNVSLDGNTTPRSRTTFSYDGSGNLINYLQYWYSEGSNSFVKSTELKFSGFDNKRYAKNSDSFDYILQPLTFFVNNPGRKEFIGGYSPIEHYSYTYDDHGYPTLKRTSYTYDKPLPSMEAVFEY